VIIATTSAIPLAIAAIAKASCGLAYLLFSIEDFDFKVISLTQIKIMIAHYLFKNDEFT
jgi:hypothetical protein